jgi:hypothetical protein
MYVFMAFCGAGAGGLAGIFIFWMLASRFFGDSLGAALLVAAAVAPIGAVSFPWLWYRLGKPRTDQLLSASSEVPRMR